MTGFIQNIEKATASNQDFRRVLYTATHCQIVLMSLKPDEDIGVETHTLDQFFRLESGSGQMTMNDVMTEVHDGDGIIVPAGVKHNLKNTGKVDLKLYTLYAPPNHQKSTVHHTRADAMRAHEHFDGKTS